MAESELLRQARQGDATAIATLLTEQLSPHGITVKAQWQDHGLQIRLETPQVPQPQRVIAFLQSRLTRLQLATGASVEVFAYLPGSSTPSWSQSFACPAPLPGKEAASPRQPASISQQSPAAESHAQSTPEAIATLLQWAFVGQDIQVSVRLDDRCLAIVLQSLRVPDQDTTVALVCRELKAWKAKLVDLVEVIVIYGQQAERDYSTWMQVVTVLSTDAPNSLEQLAILKSKPILFSSRPDAPARPQTVTPGPTRKAVTSDRPPATVQILSPEAGKTLALSLGLSVLILLLPPLSFLLTPLITIVHELGHTLFAWIFGYPAIPAFDFIYGGGMTLHFSTNPAIVIVFMVYVLLGGALYFYRHNSLTAKILLGLIATHGICQFTKLHEILIIFMGHGLELIFAGVFLYRAISGFGCRYGLEQPLYGMLGFFMVFRNIGFAHRLMVDREFQDIYMEGKWGIDHDFMRLATDYFNVNLPTISFFFLLLCLLTPVLVGVWFHYRNFINKHLLQPMPKQLN